MELYNKMKEAKLINQGSYGCVFKPGYTCNGKVENNEKYITKVQKRKTTSSRETKIGNLIKKIKNYSKYYAPILETCEINLNKITKSQEMEKCNFIDTKTKDIYESNKIQYVGKETLADYYSNELDNSTEIFKTMLEQHIILLEGLHKMSEKKLIHLDLKNNNIMVNDKKRPIIIDFGLSFENKDLEKEDYEKIFFVYGPDYSPWCIEIAMISYICNEMGEDWIDKDISTETIEKIVKDYINKNTTIKKYLNEEERQEFTENMIEYFQKKENIGEKMVQGLLETSETWDNYALNVIYLEFFYHLQLEKCNHIPFIKEYEQFLKREIMINPKERKTIKESMKIVNKLFGNIDKKEYNSFIESFTTSLKTKETIHQIRKNILNKQIEDTKTEKHFYSYLLL